MSNQTVREAAYAVLDSWAKQFGCLENDMQKLESALSQPEPEPTLCGMDEKTLKMILRRIKRARQYDADGCHHAAADELRRAVNILPVDRKTWTVPETHCDKLDVSVVARSEWPKGVRIIIDSNGWDWMFYDITIGVSQEIDITDPDNPFIVGDES